MALDSSKIVYGGSMALFVNTSGTTAQPLAFSTSAKLDVSVATREISSKDHGLYTERVASKISWNASSDALVTELMTISGATYQTYDELYTLMVAAKPVAFAFASMSGTYGAYGATMKTGNKKFTGLAIITSLSLNAPDQDNASYSVTLDGTGILTMATA